MAPKEAPGSKDGAAAQEVRKNSKEGVRKNSKEGRKETKDPFAVADKHKFRASGVGGVDVSAGVEGATKEAQVIASRIVQYEAAQERYKQEEDFERIQEQLDYGMMTEEEARKLVARAKLHEAEAVAGPQAQAAMAAADFASTTVILESMLDTNPEKHVNPVFLWFLRLFRLDKLHFRAIAEKKRRQSRGYVHKYPRLRAAVESTWFDVVVGVVMIMNGAVIGLQASNPEAGTYDGIDQFFTAFFLLEVALRMIVAGWSWIWDAGNFSDTMLIFVTGVLPQWILGPAGVEASSMRSLAVLRVLRLIRLVRMVRMFTFFRIFWSLIQGILDSCKALLYTYVIMTLVLYVFSIFAVYLIARDPVFEEDKDAQKYFGDVPKSMFTLFQVITLDSWTEVARPLMKKSDIVAPFFTVVLLVVTLALLNLVVAVIVNNAFDRAKQDEELLATRKREEMAAEIKDLSDLFLEIDLDGSGMLSKEEYDDALANNEDVIAKFEVLEILPSEYQDMWDILDEGSGEVDVTRFADLFHSLKGEAKAKDTFSILRRLEGANTKLVKLSERLKKHQGDASELRESAALVRKQLSHMESDMAEFLKEVAPVLPPKR